MSENTSITSENDIKTNPEIENREKVSDKNSQEKNSSNKFLLVKRMGKWIKPHTKTFLLCLLLLLFTTGIKLIGPVIIQKSVDNYIIPKDFQGLFSILFLYISLLIIGFISNYIEIIKLQTVGQSIVAEIKKNAFNHLLSLNMSYFDKTTTGKLVSRVENDSNSMLILFTSVITNILGSILQLIGIMCVMGFLYNGKIALSVLILLPIIILGALLFDKVISPILVNVRKYVAELTGYITEIVHGISIIQIFGQEKKILSELEKRSLTKFKSDSIVVVSFNTFFNLLFFSESIGVVIVLWIGTKMVMNGNMTIGTLILFVTFLKNLFIPIIYLSGQFNEFQRGIAGAIRVFELLDNKNTILEPEVSKIIPDKDNGVDIEFKNVWFKYNENSDWVLKDLNFKCPKGEHWAIVGPTGSGKTTIISLLLKFYIPQKGEILLNGINIKDISKENLREVIGLVLQENVLFPGSITENLTLNNDTYSFKDVEALMSELGIDNVIKKLPEGYNTELKENATNLSSGEKQLISFGRALLKNPSLLIFDEATSNIDPEIERKIKLAMNKLIKGRTALIIAHRLSTIQNADKIMVLKNGKIIEIGNHKELINFGGFYSQLNTLQAI